MTPEELDRYLKLFALVTQGLQQLLPFLERMKQQGGETTEQILVHAEEANKEARKIIDAL